MLTPGLRFLARALPVILSPAAFLYAGAHLLKHFRGVTIDPWIKWPLIAASYPLFCIFSHARYCLWKRIDAARRGAQLTPTIRGRLPGNIDVLWLLDSANARGVYLDSDIEPFQRTLGNIFNMKFLWTDTLATFEPSHIKQILATDFANFEKGHDWIHTADGLLGDGVFNSDGRLWQFHRSMTRPFFSRDRITHFDIFARHADEALLLAKGHLAEGTAIDLQDIYARFTMDTATEFLFGRNVHSLHAGLPYPAHHSQKQSSHTSDTFATAFAKAQEVLFYRTSLYKYWPLYEIIHDKMAEPMKDIDAFVKPIVEDAFARKAMKLVADAERSSKEVEEGETMLDYLVRSTDDKKLVKDEIINITVAGRDTTASLLTMASYLLSQHPDVLRRLREEIFSIVGRSRNPSIDDIREMKFMRAVLNETLRLFPPVPWDVRSSIEATTFSNPDPDGKPFYVPPRTPVNYSVFIMHRRTDLWGPDAASFDPDRFLDARLQKYFTPNPFIFVPFNAGPRICLGQQFAYNEASFMLAKLLQTFDHIELDPTSQPADSIPPAWWKDVPGRASIEKIMPRAHITVYSYGGLWVKMRESRSS